MKTKDWLAAIGALSVSLNAAEAQQAGEGNRAGVTAAVNTTTSGRLGDTSRTLFIGNDVFRDERISTDANGRAQLLFLDQSAVTIGPSAELTIDRFVYDERTKLGTLAVQASRGLIRFVGGDLSKAQDVVVRTPTALIGIRGGITLINVDANGGTNAIFVFGSQMSVTSNQTGATQTVTRPGFSVAVQPNQPPAAPIRVPGATLTGLLAQLEAPTPPGGPGAGGGGVTVPPPRQISPDRTITQTRAQTDTQGVQTLNSVNRISNQSTIRNTLTQTRVS